MGGNLSLLDSEIDEPTQPEADGNDLAFAPELAYTAFARYETTIGDNLGGSIGATLAYTGDHYLTVFNDPIEKQDYTLVGIHAAIWNDAKGWELSFYGKNLTDEIYATNAFGDGGIFISEPRSYGARLRFNF